MQSEIHRKKNFNRVQFLLQVSNLFSLGQCQISNEIRFAHFSFFFFCFLSGEKKHSTKSSNVTVTRERRTGKELKKKKKKKKK